MNNPRETVLLALYDIEYSGAYSNMVLKEVLKKHPDPRDRAFITELVYGVVRRKLTLDYIISKYSKVKLKKLSRYVLQILRMGVYQLYFTDKIPESAAVNESVNLAKRYAVRSKGFVNGILHSVIRGRDTLKYPKDSREYLSVKYSFPLGIIDIFSAQDSCEELLESLNDEPKTTVRINSLKNEPLTIDAMPCELDIARTLKGIDIGSCEDYKKGRIIAQDMAAMLAGLALSPKPGDVCVDVCAAPGGKTTHLAEMMENKGEIYAFDLHPHKVEIIKKNAERMGISIINAAVCDAKKPWPALEEKADKVLADVPCSGLGIIRRKPDIKWNKEDIQSLPNLQRSILKAAASYLRVGGELVYSTCTLNKKENEDVILGFLKDNPNFEPVKIRLPGKFDRDNNGYITLYPNIDGTDGFFISKIKRIK